MDHIIQAIEHGHIAPSDICFNLIRRHGGADYGIREQLNYGRKTIINQEQLAQYPVQLWPDGTKPMAGVGVFV